MSKKNITWGWWWKVYKKKKNKKKNNSLWEVGVHENTLIEIVKKGKKDYSMTTSPTMRYTQMNKFDENLECKGIFSFALYKPLAIKIRIFSNRLMQLEGWAFLWCKNAQLLFAYWHMNHQLIVSMIMFELEKPRL